VRSLIIVALILAQAVAAEAEAQSPRPEMKRWSRDRLDMEIKRLKQDREIGKTPEQKALDMMRRELRRFRPIFCEAFWDGQWVGMPCD
jgi:hypothetical protein